MAGFPSGQRDQTVNLTAMPSKVRILLPPPFLTSINNFIGVVAQLVSVPACHAGGCEFESRLLRHLIPSYKSYKHHTELLRMQCTQQ